MEWEKLIAEIMSKYLLVIFRHNFVQEMQGYDKILVDLRYKSLSIIQDGQLPPGQMLLIQI